MPVRLAEGAGFEPAIPKSAERSDVWPTIQFQQCSSRNIRWNKWSLSTASKNYPKDMVALPRLRPWARRHAIRARRFVFLWRPDDTTNELRFSPAIDPRFSYRGEDVVQALERICGEVGYPKAIRVDQGSEFISRDLDLWAYQKDVVLDFSRPGKPTDTDVVGKRFTPALVDSSMAFPQRVGFAIWM